MNAKHFEVILYQEDGWTAEKILSVLNAWPIVDTYAFIFHDMDTDDDGTMIKAHYHIYIAFGKSATSSQSVANRFRIDENKVNKIETNRYLTLRYFLHIGTDKHLYQINQMEASFDVQAYFDSRSQRKTLDRILEDCAAGLITRSNYKNYIPAVTFSKYRNQIENSWLMADETYLAAERITNIPVIWVYGSSGTGKTTVCKLFSAQQNLPVYITANGNDPFSKYKDQPSIILDELRPHEQYTYVDLLQILDPHTIAAVHSRYADKVLKPQILWITSIFSPMEYYEALHLQEKESAVQLFRRLHEVWHVEKQFISISHYDMNKGCFVTTDKNILNPVPAYVAAQAAKHEQETQLNSVALLGDIAKQYQAITPVSLPVPVDKHTTNDTEKEVLPFPDSQDQESSCENLSLFKEST